MAKKQHVATLSSRTKGVVPPGVADKRFSHSDLLGKELRTLATKYHQWKRVYKSSL